MPEFAKPLTASVLGDATADRKSRLDGPPRRRVEWRNRRRRGAESQIADGAELLALHLELRRRRPGPRSTTPDDLLGRIFSTFCIGK